MGDRAKQEYVRKCDKQFLDCMSECAKNVIKGNVLTSRQMTNLRRKKNDLRALSKRKTSLQAKIRKILQKGGFLSAILPPILSVLASLLLQN